MISFGVYLIIHINVPPGFGSNIVSCVTITQYTMHIVQKESNIYWIYSLLTYLSFPPEVQIQ